MTTADTLRLAALWSVERDVFTHYRFDSDTLGSYCRACNAEINSPHTRECWWQRARREGIEPIKVLLPDARTLTEDVAHTVELALGQHFPRNANAARARAMLKRWARMEAQQLRN